MNEPNIHLKHIAYEMIRSAAPEREAELLKMWEEYSPEFIYSSDTQNFVLEAGAYGSLRLTDRTLRLIWIFGHITWKTLHLYSGLIHLCSSSGAVFDMGKIETDPEQKRLNSEIQSLLKKFHEFKEIESVTDFEWPESIPPPAYKRPTDDNENTAVYDLTGMAMVYVFLHELKHIQFGKDPEKRPGYIEEELLCDSYARSFLFDEISKYSIISAMT